MSAVDMPKYELPIPSESAPVATGVHSRDIPLAKGFLLKNETWFCHFRWLVVVVFALVGLLSFSGQECPYLGMQFRTWWMLGVAGVLAVFNICFLWSIRILSRSEQGKGLESNLWLQIIFDLLVLTVVIHYLGSLETNAHFLYLFHIVLACIFFPPRRSIVVTLMAIAMYLSCVSLEIFTYLPSAGIYIQPDLRETIVAHPPTVAIEILSSLAIWLIVWYLASHLSSMVQEGRWELMETNSKLVEMQEERRQHMLRMAHELKAPFAAIHANTQLITKGYCGEITEEARKVLDRISERCRQLTTGIQEMLQLANLRSAAEESRLSWIEVDLANVLGRCIDQVEQIARARGITLKVDLKPVKVTAVEEHIWILFVNLLTNAVVYSHEGGQVEITCGPAGEESLGEVLIVDHGIGIPEKNLPLVFNEYFRSQGASTHNKSSTGLGLTIVKHIAEAHGIQLTLESQLGVGSKFTLVFGKTRE